MDASQAEQYRNYIASLERQVAHTDQLVGIIRDAQERLARPGPKLEPLREILQRLHAEARKAREKLFALGNGVGVVDGAGCVRSPSRLGDHGSDLAPAETF